MSAPPPSFLCQHSLETRHFIPSFSMAGAWENLAKQTGLKEWGTPCWCFKTKSGSWEGGIRLATPSMISGSEMLRLPNGRPVTAPIFKTRLLDCSIFRKLAQLPHDLADRGCWSQLQCWIMMFDCPCSFGINVGSHDDCSHWVLIGRA